MVVVELWFLPRTLDTVVVRTLGTIVFLRAVVGNLQPTAGTR